MTGVVWSSHLFHESQTLQARGERKVSVRGLCTKNSVGIQTGAMLSLRGRKGITMKRAALFTVAGLVIVVCGPAAQADVISYCDTASFTSDTELDIVLSLPSFNTSGGLTLNSVTVDIFHNGSANIRGDNDDDFNECDVNARMIRTWTATGPDVFQLGNETVTSAVINLGVDNGDDGVFDDTPPDGTDFGGPLSYDLLSGSHDPAKGLYETVGPGTVDFVIDVLTMVNDQQFIGPSPDQWQLEVQNPILDVEVCVTYDYIPEPATLSLLVFGGLALLRKRR